MGERNVKLIREIAHKEMSEVVIRRTYGLTIKQYNRFTERHADRIKEVMAQKYRKMFIEQL